MAMLTETIATPCSSWSMWIMVTSNPHMQFVKNETGTHFRVSKIMCALGQIRGMVWGGRREGGSGWGTHVYLWQIHFDIWQN